MATYPLKPYQPSGFLGRSPSAQTNEAEAYKAMLGAGVAGEDVGLFYQLNQTSEAVAEDVKVYDRGESALFKNITRYGNYADPIEAGGKYS